jgi:tRNA-modifying protein YgfZ
MISKWHQWLIDSGANLRTDRVLDFGDPETEVRVTTAENILCDLSHMGLIEASGEEATQFLQGQFSNDINQVHESRSQLSSYCNPKGRMIAIFRIFKRGQSYFLRLPIELLESTLRRLRMFVLRAKVELNDASHALIRIGYCGPAAENELKALAGQIPEDVNDCVRAANSTIIRVPGPRPRYEIYGEFDAVKLLWQRMKSSATPVGASQWALLDILSGMPTVLAPTREAFVPQMANLDLVGGISYSKGCYPGQEVVARMHYLGTLKRRMYRIHLNAPTPPQAGDSVFSSESSNEQPVGTIVDAQRDGSGGSTGLAIMQISEAEKGKLRLNAPEGPSITLDNLPYTLNASSL